MAGSICSVVALVLVFVACVELCDAATAVDVYRLIQYDMGGIPFGSRAAGLNHIASAPPFPPGADLSRSVAILRTRELNLGFLQDCIRNKNSLGGLLLLLPQKIGDNVGDGLIGKEEKATREALVDLERLLVNSELPYPVYFAFEDETIKSMLADVRASENVNQSASATTGGYKLVVSTAEPKKIQSPTLTNIQGWLPGLKGEGDANQLPTIAIVASYDTFGAAPALSVGSDSNGSGAVALLEIARLFSVLYSSPKTRGRYNILFGLTSGGPYNYNGTLMWLKSLDQRVRESIDYAICLNSIGSSNGDLWMHISKPPENALIKQIYESLADVAGELGVKIGIKHKKINISNPRVAWEHEQFSRLRLTAFTLSGLSRAPELLESSGGLYDTRSAVDEKALLRSTKIVAESLARHIYGFQGNKINVFEDNSSLGLNSAYMKSWLDLFSRTSRVAPFLSKGDPLISSLKKELSDHTAEVSLQHEVIDGMFSFYDTSTARLSIYQVASITFDLFLFLAVGSYLTLLFSFLVIATRGLDDLLGIFRRPPPRKLKIS
ncbi:M28 Zn-peptidase nicastrin [Wolffia australiana]